MKSQYLIVAAKLLSTVFAPFYLPVMAFLVLFMFSYMRVLPLDYKLMVLVMVYTFTVLLPLCGTYIFRKVSRLASIELLKREHRVVPYLIFIVCYGLCLYVMMKIHMPHFMISILFGAFVLQIVCALLNNWIRISTHSAGGGAMVGALMAFSFVFSFDPTWWLCLTLLIAGAVGSSRLILRRHALREVNLGLAVGWVCGFLSILFV